MVQRISAYERKPRDLYETPDWVAQALINSDFVTRKFLWWEPACATGKIARAVGAIFSSDLVTDFGITLNFLESKESDFPEAVNAIITNPPFNREAEKFIRHGLGFLRSGRIEFMAMLLPIDFDSGKTRKDMFGNCLFFAGKGVLTSRIIFIEGPNASPTTNHAWYVWDATNKTPPLIRYLDKP